MLLAVQHQAEQQAHAAAGVVKAACRASSLGARRRGTCQEREQYSSHHMCRAHSLPTIHLRASHPLHVLQPRQQRCSTDTTARQCVVKDHECRTCLTCAKLQPTHTNLTIIYGEGPAVIGHWFTKAADSHNLNFFVRELHRQTANQQSIRGPVSSPVHASGQGAEDSTGRENVLEHRAPSAKSVAMRMGTSKLRSRKVTDKEAGGRPAYRFIFYLVFLHTLVLAQYVCQDSCRPPATALELQAGVYAR